jgi:hypothetical protein
VKPPKEGLQLAAELDDAPGGAPPGTRTPNPLIKRRRNYLLFRAPQCRSIPLSAGPAISPLALVLGRADMCRLVSEPMDAQWTHIGISRCLGHGSLGESPRTSTQHDTRLLAPTRCREDAASRTGTPAESLTSAVRDGASLGLSLAWTDACAGSTRRPRRGRCTGHSSTCGFPAWSGRRRHRCRARLRRCRAGRARGW